MTNHDPLELELIALRPREASAELKRRIAGRLAVTSVDDAKERRSSWRGSAMVGGLLAASLAAVIVWQDHDQAIAPEAAAAPEHRIATVFDPSLPSLWSYRAALLQSPDSLDALLDQHADQTLVSKSDAASAFVLARSNLTKDSSLGEL